MSVKPKNVMIIEDEVLTQRYLKDVLQEQDIHVMSCVDNAEDALEVLEKNQCDLILMDININGPIDGLHLAKRVLDKYEVCIIFITAYCDKYILSEAVELSPFGFIVKPFVPQNVESTIQIGYKRFLVSAKKNPQEKVIEEHDVKISDDIIYSMSKATLFYNNTPIDFSIRQIKLIGLLCKHINTIVRNEVIISEIWGDKVVRDTSLRTLVYSIRKQVPSIPIITYSKVGYMLKVSV